MYILLEIKISNKLKMLLVLLMVDGLGYEYLTPQDTPFWWTHSHKITNQIPTITAPNWISILTGHPTSHHKITKNEMVSKVSYIHYPGTTLADDIHPSLLISDWNIMRKFTHNSFLYTRNGFEELSRQIKKRSHGIIILNLDKLDTIAHNKGWGSKSYYRVAKFIDQATHRIAHQLERKKIPFVLMGVADHGGVGKNHENHLKSKIRNVPWLWVSNVKDYSPSLTKTINIRALVNKIYLV